MFGPILLDERFPSILFLEWFINMMKVSRVWFLFFCVKVFYVFFAHLIYGNFSQLGDTSRYFSSGFNSGAEALLYSTAIMENIGFILKLLFRSELVGSLLVSIVSFVAIYCVIRRLNLTLRELKLTLFLMSFPSFAMWTSILSKEAIVQIGFCLIFPLLQSVILSQSVKYSKSLFFLGLYILVVFKPQYMPSIMSLVFYFSFFNYFKAGVMLRSIFALVSFCFLLLLVYSFRNEIDLFANNMYVYFVTDGESSTRNDLDIFSEQYGFFYNLPYGIYLSLWGPNLIEATHKLSFFPIYVESTLMFVSYCYLFRRLCVGGRMNISYIFVLLLSVFLILIVHYPVGVYNPGSAVRYRSGFLFYILFIGLLLLKRYQLRLR